MTPSGQGGSYSFWCAVQLSTELQPQTASNKPTGVTGTTCIVSFSKQRVAGFLNFMGWFGDCSCLHHVAATWWSGCTRKAESNLCFTSQLVMAGHAVATLTLCLASVGRQTAHRCAHSLAALARVMRFCMQNCRSPIKKVVLL